MGLGAVFGVKVSLRGTWVKKALHIFECDARVAYAFLLRFFWKIWLCASFLQTLFGIGCDLMG